MRLISLVSAAVLVAGAASAAGPASPAEVQAEGHDLRIDVTWAFPAPAGVDGYHVYRASAAEGPFERLTESPQDFAVYSDWLGENGVERFYRVTAVAGGLEGAPGPVVTARTMAMSREELLTSVQKAHFRYFWQFGHPVSGLAREGFVHKRNVCTSGGTGFGLMTIMVGAERGFVSRAAAAANVLKQVRFLEDVTPRYHGVWAHWIDGETGATIPFSGKEDNGGDIVETAFLVQGLLTVAQYFDGDEPAEREIRERVERMWRAVDWDFYRGDPKGDKLVWHWSPDYQFKKNHRFGGHFNECMIAYVLGLCSPTHPLPVASYYEGWTGKPRREGDQGYANGNEYFGIRQPVGWPMGGPLFFTHYSYLGLDPRYVTDRYCNYYENNRAISLIHQAYCRENPEGHAGYGEKVWGLTASTGPGGYFAHEPRRDRGTITPTAALSAMPYTPAESLGALEHFYRELGGEIWGHLGFRDAFNPGEDWVSGTFLAIDQGPIAPMIENYRTQLCWRMFMKNADVVAGLQRAGLLASEPARLAEPAGGGAGGRERG